MHRTLQHRTRSPFLQRAASIGLALGLLTPSALGQGSPSLRSWSSNVVVPQARCFHFGEHASPLAITGVAAHVAIEQQVATTVLDITLHNPSGARQEAELLVPVPEGSVIRGFDFQGTGQVPSAEVLPRSVAKHTYRDIVRKLRDPALLEFAGYQLVRSSVFPIEPSGTQQLRLTYEQLLASSSGRIDYVLPRSESIGYRVPWTYQVSIKAKQEIATLYSPSHPLDTQRLAPNAMTARVNPSHATEPGAFRVSVIHGGSHVAASLYAYPALGKDAGYFLLVAGLPPRPASEGQTMLKREITLVLDRSGSMAGEKIEQVREAAKQILAGLQDGETFNIISYNDQVTPFAAQPVVRSRETMKDAIAHLEGLAAGGGTNLHDALAQALAQAPSGNVLPIVLFLTDGLPTVGNTSEVAIRELATQQNPHERRVFTFGVGADVNTPLLNKIAASSRASATFVLPQEDVEVKVAQVFSRLAGPILASPELVLQTQHGDAAPRRLHDIIPKTLPDVFEGDQIVLVGRYQGDDPLHFVLNGNYLGETRTFRFSFELDGSRKNAFVPRLWASRRIAQLTEIIRESGAGMTAAQVGNPTNPFQNVASAQAPAPGQPGAMPAHLKELVDEIVRLSIEYGVLSEYTAFLAREGTDLGSTASLLSTANDNFVNRAMTCRTGIASINQEFNNPAQLRQSNLNFRNGYWADNMERVEITTVQQVCDLAFFNRGGRWVDSRLVNPTFTNAATDTESAETQPAEVDATNDVQPDVTLTFGSDPFFDLLERLVAEGRQGSLALNGEILIEVDGKRYLVVPAADAIAPEKQDR